MKVIFFTGLSASGKSTIASRVAENLGLPVVSLHDVLRVIARREGFAKTREWIASVGIKESCSLGALELVSFLERIPEKSNVVVDDLLDLTTLGVCRQRFGCENVSVVYIKTNRHARRRWAIQRLGLPPAEGLKELRFLDGLKNAAGMKDVVAQANLEFANNARLEEVVNIISRSVGELLLSCSVGVERRG